MRSVTGTLLVCVALLVGCGSRDGSDETREATGAAGEAAGAITRTSQEGPVEAVVTVSPAEPMLGDPLVLTLEVESEAGVSVEMPAFGEALGRFSISDFTPRDRTESDGRRIQSQRYTLQAPMSGRQRIPPLRLEFIDERPGQISGGGEPAVRELLTDEIQVKVQSVLPDDAPVEDLRPPRGTLHPLRNPLSPVWWIAGILLVAALAVLGWQLGRRYALERKRLTAYDRAMARLVVLEARGLPTGSEADAWYVEISDIVRRYLEDRYSVRAPELTTEEFLREARRSAELGHQHQELLSAFLEGCDRVKFAAYHPDVTESRDILQVAGRFLEETRLRPEEEKERAKARGETVSPWWWPWTRTRAKDEERAA